MTRAAIYTRISRDRVGAGLGVARQRADCEDLAVRNGWTVHQVYSDNDLSAYSGKPRPGYRRLLAGIAAGTTDVVVAWHTDRLHRSTVELEEYIAACEPRGVPTVTVKAGPLDLSTPSGRLVARQMAAVARYEVEHSIERQRRAKLQAATDGRWKGGRRPYGFEADGVTVRPDEAAEVLRMSEAVLAGTSLRSLAADMNSRGLVTSTGRPWRQDSVRRVLMRARNASLMEHRAEIVGPASWPPIVPEPMWRGVVAVLSDPTRRTQWSSARRWMLSGLALCGVCGSPLICTLLATTRRAVPSYVCKAGKCVVRNAAALDEAVTAVVVARLSRPDAAELLAAEAGADTSALHLEAVAVRERLDGLAAAYADGAVDARQLRAGSDRLRARLVEIEHELGELSRGSVLSGLVGVPDVAAEWGRLDLDRRRAVIDALMTVVVKRAPRGRPKGWRPGESYFDPTGVRIEWKVDVDALMPGDDQ